MIAAIGQGGREEIVVDLDEVLEAFSEVMKDWGHFRTAEGLRFPTPAEVRRVAGGRSVVRGWNTAPLA